MSSPASMAAGWDLLALQDFDGALTAFDQSLATRPSAEAYAGKARALFLTGQLAAAEANYDNAIAKDPGDMQWHVGLSIVQLARGRTDMAIEACTRALALNPASAKAYYNRAYAQDRSGRPDLALLDYTQAIELEPNWAEAYNSRGVCRARLGDFESAKVDFHQALALAPLPSAHANCASAYYALGQAEAALAELNTAIKLERSQPQHLIQRGRIYLDHSRPDLAEEDFALALTMDPSNSRYRQLLVESRAGAGALGEAPLHLGQGD